MDSGEKKIQKFWKRILWGLNDIGRGFLRTLCVNVLFRFFFFGRKCKCDFNDSRIIRKELSYSSQHQQQYISVTVHSNWNKSCVNAGIITLQLKTRDILTHFGTLGLFDWEANANHPLWYSVKIIFFYFGFFF